MIYQQDANRTQKSLNSIDEVQMDGWEIIQPREGKDIGKNTEEEKICKLFMDQKCINIDPQRF